jgi:hypothetical protein
MDRTVQYIFLAIDTVDLFSNTSFRGCKERRNCKLHNRSRAVFLTCETSLILGRVSRISKSRASSVGIALGYELDDRGSRVRFPAGAGNFFLHHRVQNGSGTHSASYPMGATAVKIQVEVFWVVTPCSVVIGYQCFG